MTQFTDQNNADVMICIKCSDAFKLFHHSFFEHSSELEKEYGCIPQNMCAINIERAYCPEYWKLFSFHYGVTLYRVRCIKKCIDSPEFITYQQDTSILYFLEQAKESLLEAARMPLCKAAIIKVEAALDAAILKAKGE